MYRSRKAVPAGNSNKKWILISVPLPNYSMANEELDLVGQEIQFLRWMGMAIDHRLLKGMYRWGFPNCSQAF